MILQFYLRSIRKKRKTSAERNNSLNKTINNSDILPLIVTTAATTFSLKSSKASLRSITVASNARCHNSNTICVSGFVSARSQPKTSPSAAGSSPPMRGSSTSANMTAARSWNTSPAGRWEYAVSKRSK
ncbi:hypothetical protein BC937DRAFT_87298 [Endogone sp. FLAS-F59071]|nr:hypothetical protein BC937DRAFT_87298 [Endogone sp. FLAS-F59071]|eukprot:RUS19551.1 hypothetical protein BC937DRAFT_87298 [Endogone sp. FLAS-F59071]